MTNYDDHIHDDRPDRERAADAALGHAVSHAARELLAEGESPRSVATAFMSTALALALEHYGQEPTVLLLRETADDVESLPLGAGCAGQA